MADIQKIIEIVFQGTDNASTTFTTVGPYNQFPIRMKGAQ